MSQRIRTTYTNEFKQEAVDLILEQGYSTAEASRNLGINYNMLSRWKNERKKDGEHAFPSKGQKSLGSRLAIRHYSVRLVSWYAHYATASRAVKKWEKNV